MNTLTKNRTFINIAFLSMIDVVDIVTNLVGSIILGQIRINYFYPIAFPIDCFKTL